MRNPFPDDANALVVTSHGYGTPLLSGAGITYEVFTTVDATAHADITWTDGTPIPNSVITTDQTSCLPSFLGPDDDSIELWLRQVGTTRPEPIYARLTGNGGPKIVGVPYAEWPPTTTKPDTLYLRLAP